jgi:Leucine-rich repeat (LRR) protein
MLISVLGKSRYSQLEADANMILTDDEDDKKVKFLLTKSKHDMGSFVNIETAIDQHEQTKPQLKEVKNQLLGMMKQRNESNEILKQVSTGIKNLRPSDLIPTLRVIDLSSNRLRSLPDELTSLINLVDLRLDHNLIKKLPS